MANKILKEYQNLVKEYAIYADYWNKKHPDETVDVNVFIESNDIYTIGNENHLRDALNTLTKKAYYDYNDYNERLFLLREKGEKVSETTSALPIDQITSKDDYYKISEVKTIKKKGSFKEDNYILTRQIDNINGQKSYSTYKLSFNDDRFNDYDRFISTDGDVVYIKHDDFYQSNMEMFRYDENTESMVSIGQGEYKYSLNSLNIYNNSRDVQISGDKRVVIYGAGGGGGGGSYKDRWKTHGGAGGSGALFDAIISFNGRYHLEVGKGGQGGSVHGKGGDWGKNGTPSSISKYEGESLILLCNIGAGEGGQGSFKKNNYGPYPYCGAGGIVNVYTSYNKLYRSINGKQVDKKRSWGADLDGAPSVTPGDVYINNVYIGTNIGRGGNAYHKQSGTNGKNGVIVIYNDGKMNIIFNNKEYAQDLSGKGYPCIITQKDINDDREALSNIKKYLKM